MYIHVLKRYETCIYLCIYIYLCMYVYIYTYAYTFKLAQHRRVQALCRCTPPYITIRQAFKRRKAVQHPARIHSSFQASAPKHKHRHRHRHRHKHKDRHRHRHIEWLTFFSLLCRSNNDGGSEHERLVIIALTQQQCVAGGSCILERISDRCVDLPGP